MCDCHVRHDDGTIYRQSEDQPWSEGMNAQDFLDSPHGQKIQTYIDEGKRQMRAELESEGIVVEITGLDEHGNYRAEPMKGYLDPVRGTYRLTRLRKKNELAQP